jgi:dTDP-4-amino-4,6-dideoxygalactose transaminase
MHIEFSPPDISDLEVEAVSAVLRSGWLTTGSVSRDFEKSIAAFAGVPSANAVCFGSCTAALEMCLRALGVGPGDEVVAPAYTYTATAAVAVHVGAKLVLVDSATDGYEMDCDRLAEAITARTRVVIPVDIAGVCCDYAKIRAVIVASAAPGAIILADAAHSLGASYQGQPAGSQADFSAFSFHAVKNVTSGEGGALVWRSDQPGLPGFDSAAFARRLRLLSLHGQSKDALTKNQAGGWEYDIELPGYKCNLTDIQAALGRAQLSRYPQMLDRRRELARRYNQVFGAYHPVQAKPESSSCHLYMLELPEKLDRDQLICEMAAADIACNVHYKPLPMLTAYRQMGFAIADYPRALAHFRHELTLPLYSTLSDAEQDYVITTLQGLING